MMVDDIMDMNKNYNLLDIENMDIQEVQFLMDIGLVVAPKNDETSSDNTIDTCTLETTYYCNHDQKNDHDHESDQVLYSPIYPLVIPKDNTHNNNDDDNDNAHHICSLFYDFISMAISVADLITDILVLLSFYDSNEMIYFGVSLSIIIIAQMAYCVAFLFRFSSDESVLWHICHFCLLIPFAPILSFIFYFASNDNAFVLQSIFPIFGFVKSKDKKADKDKPSLKKWMEHKMQSHYGFVLEAMLEALPQSIIQMTAIVMMSGDNNNNNNNSDYILYISYISVVISMLSVCLKSFVISQAIQFKLSVFLWLCLVCDFFAIFTIVSWVFYDPSFDMNYYEFGGLANDGNQQNAYELISKVWIYKLLFFTFPFTTLVCGCILKEINGSMMQTCNSRYMIRGYLYGNCRDYLNFKFFGFVVFQCILLSILMILIFPFAFLLFEIMNMSWLALSINLFNHVRFIDSDGPLTMWSMLFDWIESSNDHSQLKSRLCIINYFLSGNKSHRNLEMQTFLEANEHNSYSNVTFLDLRENNKYKSQATLVREMNKRLHDDLDSATYDWVFWWLFFYVVTPSYIFSKFCTFLFPFFAVIIVNSSTTDILQIVLTLIYSIFAVCILCLFPFVMWSQYVTWHIMPGRAWNLKNQHFESNAFMKICVKFENLLPKIKQEKMEIICQKWDFVNANIANIIMDYLPIGFSQKARNIMLHSRGKPIEIKLS